MNVVNRLLIFTRFPEPGKVKTRLIDALGAQGAADLHRRLTVHTLSWVDRLVQACRVELVVHYDGGCQRQMRTCFGEHLTFVPQIAGTLGERLAEALAVVSIPTIVIGTDCPDLTPAHISDGFSALERADVVLGPATDGGYYLIGLKRPQPQLFAEIPWGTDQVCRVTCRRAEDSGLQVELLDVLWDVDRPEDLRRLAHEFPDGALPS